jgi:uncharacterized protein (TIRG00374 family)
VAAPGDSSAAVVPPVRSTRRRQVRWVVGTVLLAVLAVEVVLVGPSLTGAVKRLGDVSWGWVVAAVVAEAVSMSSFARLQKALLNAAEVPVRQKQSLAVVYASNAMSVSLPGGPLFATTFTFRQSRHWGASRVVASWQLAMSGVLSTGVIALIGVGAALTVGGTANPVGLVTAVVLTFLLVFGVRFVVRHPDSLLAVGRSVLRRVNRVRHRPKDDGLERWVEVLGQLESVQLGRRSGALTITWAALNWAADIATLGFACLAAGAEPSISGLLIAYAAGKAVATVPLLPGGLGVVDGAMTATLVAGGLTASAALPSVIVYRIVSFFLVAVVGWIVFAVMFRSSNHDHPDDVPTPPAGTPVAGASPQRPGAS